MKEEFIKSIDLKVIREARKNELETERLILLPLQAESLALSLEDYESMQKNLGLNILNTTLDDEMQYAMNVRLRKVLEDVDHYMWLTNWAIVHKKENQIIGFIMLKGVPNEKGEVIVGYGIDENFRRRRFATEALQRLIEWVFESPKALSVIADTEKTNISSHKVLENLGATQYKETDDLIWWKIEKQ